MPHKLPQEELDLAVQYRAADSWKGIFFGARSLCNAGLFRRWRFAPPGGEQRPSFWQGCKGSSMELQNTFLRGTDVTERMWLVLLNYSLPPVTAQLWDRGASMIAQRCHG